MDDVEVEVTGLAELQSALERLGGADARAIVREGLSQGGDALRNAMQVNTAASFTGEPGRVAAQQSSWSKSTKMSDDLAGVVRVGPKGSLPDIHVSRGRGRQPLGKIYRRSLSYLIRLCEFGPQGGKEHGALGRKFPMTGGFMAYRGAVLERVISVIKTRLNLE
jgi:hypothetical protein